MFCKKLLLFGIFSCLFKIIVMQEEILSNLNEDNDRRNYLSCAVTLVRKYFHGGVALSGFVLTMELTSIRRDLQNEFVNILHSDNTFPWTVILTTSNSLLNNGSKYDSGVPEKTQAYFLNTEPEEEFYNLFSALKTTSNWNANAQIIIALNSIEETFEELLEVMQDIILSIIHQNKLYNLYIIGRTMENKTTYGVTYFPFDPANECGKQAFSLAVLDTCHYSSEDEDEDFQPMINELDSGEFFQKYPSDLSRCPLFVGFRSWEPYIFHNNSIMQGLEHKMLQTIGEVLNLNIVYEYEMHHIYLLYQLLLDEKVDIIVGGLEQDAYMSDYVSNTITYYQDDLTTCLVKGKLKAIDFETINIIEPIPLVLILLFLASISIYILLSQKLWHSRLLELYDLQIVFLRMWGTLLGQSLPLSLIPTHLNIALIFAFFMGLLFTNIFQSVLVSKLSAATPIYQISHVREIFEEKLQIRAEVYTLKYFTKKGNIFKYIRQNLHVCQNIELCLQAAAKNNKLAVAVSRQHAFYNPRVPRDELFCFNRNENFYDFLVTMLMPKEYRLLHKINPIIQHLIESGHMLKWAQDLENTRLVKDHQKMAKANNIRILSMHELSSWFILWMVCLLISTLIFLLELWVHHLVLKKRTRVKLIKWLHKKFE